MRALVLASIVWLLATSPSSAQSDAAMARVGRSTVNVLVAGAGASGFVVGDERWILTTLCSVEGALAPPSPAPIEVRFPSGTRRWAHVLRFDLPHDLALLELEGGPSPAPPLVIGPDARPSVGTALVVNTPAGTRSGQVSGRRAGTDEHAPGTPDLILTDLPLGTGSAGSPLFDTRAHVVAIDVATERSDPQVGVAIPVAYARALLDGVRADRAARAHGGPMPPDLDDLGITAEDGIEAVHVLHVVPGSPADRAGIGGADAPMRIGFLRSAIPHGCFVMSLGGVPTPTVAALRAELATHVRGGPIPITIRSGTGRGRATATTTVTLDRLP